MPDIMHIVLHSEHILEVHVASVQVSDESIVYTICVRIITRYMPVSLPHNKDKVAKTLSLINATAVVKILYIIGQINIAISSLAGNRPHALNTLKKLAQAINHDSHFYHTIQATVILQANAASVYTTT